MRHEMNPSETFHFVTVELVSHIRRFGEENAFLVPALYSSVHSMSSFPCISLFANKLGGKRPV